MYFQKIAHSFCKFLPMITGLCNLTSSYYINKKFPSLFKRKIYYCYKIPSIPCISWVSAQCYTQLQLQKPILTLVSAIWHVLSSKNRVDGFCICDMGSDYCSLSFSPHYQIMYPNQTKQKESCGVLSSLHQRWCWRRESTLVCCQSHPRIDFSP